MFRIDNPSIYPTKSLSIMILGDYNVGKTNFVYHYVKEELPIN